MQADTMSSSDESSLEEETSYPLEQQLTNNNNSSEMRNLPLHPSSSSSQCSVISALSTLSSASSTGRVDMTGEVVHHSGVGSYLQRRNSAANASLSSSSDESSLDDENWELDPPLDDNDGGEDHSHNNNNNNNTENPRRRQKKRVSYGSIDIREYSRCLEIHPSTVKGPPIGIDWKYEEVGTFNLEEFETNRENTSHLRKRRWSFLMPAKVREALLIDSGHTEEEMQAVVQEVRKTQHQRRESFELQGLEDWFLMKEACKRRFRRWKSGVSKKREQELLWEAAAKRRAQELGKTHNQ